MLRWEQAYTCEKYPYVKVGIGTIRTRRIILMTTNATRSDNIKEQQYEREAAHVYGVHVNGVYPQPC